MKTDLKYTLTISNLDKHALAILNLIRTTDNMLIKESTDDIELTEDLKNALDESIDSLKKDGGIPNNQMMAETRDKFPNLFK